MTLTDLLTRGGPVMYLLLGCSVFALAIILERLGFWFTERKRVPHRRVHNLLSAIQKGKISGAISSSDSEKDDLINRLAQAEKEGGLTRVASLLEIEADRAYERSLRNLSGIDTVVSIAPLLGILGTVLGIMKSFQALNLQNMHAPAEVGHGLAEAMLTTATGLIIAVPALVMFNLFTSLANRHAAQLHKQAENLRHSNDSSVDSAASQEINNSSLNAGDK